MSKTRLLFLNPPSLDGRTINRHVMDPHVSKGAYIYPPYDFLMLSGWFHPSERYELRIIDAMASRWTLARTLDEIAAYAPDFILSMTAPQDFAACMSFLERLKNRVPTRLFSMGAVEHERKALILERHAFLDGMVFEPLSDDLKRYLDGEAGPFETVMDRAAVSLPIERQRAKWFTLPACRHDLIDARLYAYPAMRTDRFTSVLTSYGCPFTCTYCEAPGFKFTRRSPETVLEELEQIRSLGITEVCFKDWTFAADKRHANAILDSMIERDLGLQWFTFSRADVLDRTLIAKMKKAGCTVIQMGVETVDSDILKLYKRRNNNETLRDIFRACHEIGVETMGTFILGLPGDTEERIRETIDFVLELDPDYASFNIITPLLGSELRRDWEKQGIIDPEAYEVQDSTQAGLHHLDIAPERLIALRDEAVRRFYFRPAYIWKRARKTATWPQFKAQAATGWSLFQQSVLRRAPASRADAA